MRRLNFLSIISLATVLAIADGQGMARAEGNWEGPYIGLTGGMGWIDEDRVIHQTAPVLEIRDSFDFDESLFGIIGGHNFQRGKYVFGIEGGYLLAPDSRSVVTGVPDSTSGAFANQKWQGELLARLGYDAGPILPFITGGLEVSKFEITSFMASPFLTLPPSSETHLGIAAGAGFEWQAMENVRFRMEYRYNHFFDQLYSFESPGYYDQSIDFDSHAVRGSLIFNF